MNGVTGRMGANQHLLRSIVAIRKQGGVKSQTGDRIMPDPILVGRNPEKLQALATQAEVSRWTTDLNAALANPNDTIYFDAQTTDRRGIAVRQAIAAGKHVYCEKPVASTLSETVELYRLAKAANLKNGVVQDKLWLPGLLKLKALRDQGFFGRILSVRGEFGYWVFEGDKTPCQRPSWNYRKEEGGGIIIDMLCHFRYVLDNLFGNVQSVACLGATHIPKRWDEQDKPYAVTADDSAYSMFELEGGIIAQINASWCVRVRRDDLFVLQVDGTNGTAVAGLRECWIQPADATPRPVWNPDIPSPIHFYENWQRFEEQAEYDNAFKAEWELFLRHVADDEPFQWTLLEGAKGVQLAEKAVESWHKRIWIDVPKLEV
jgi:predicted dehydrogenase